MTRRLLVGYLLGAVVVLLVLEVPLAVFYQQRERAGSSRRRARRHRARLRLRGRPRAGDTPNPAPRWPTRAHRGARRHRRRGGLLRHRHRRRPRDLSTRPEILVALRGRSARHAALDTLETDLLYVAVPVASAGVVHGAVRLTFDTRTTALVAATGWTPRRRRGGAGRDGGHRLGDRAFRDPTAAQTRRRGGALRHRRPRAGGADPSAPPEIAVLGDTMNTMARRLDQLLTEQREFVADASHQLRTPLTALRLRLENLQSAAATAEDEDALGAAIEETNRLAALVADLLQLARAERPAEPLTVDLAALAADRVDTWSAVADATESGWTWSRPAAPSSRRRSRAASSRSWTTSSTTRSRWRRRDRVSR